ncbi:MAG: dihydrofolate reductase family protein [Clostridiales bacterium]|jgi:dihydrofolate reductase|nr:dihydrofolate reductase family protein [Clostridiales bacterium]
MGRLILCIAESLDGYIADKRGSVDFLFEKPRIEPDNEYTSFYKEVESILFGSATYDQIVEDFQREGSWPYPGKDCYVFSQSRTSGEGVIFTALSPRRFTEEVIRPAKGDSWLFGGRRLIHSFMREDLIDAYWIYVCPVILGGGVPLFSTSPRFNLDLVSTSKVDGMVKLFYNRQH